MERHSPIIAKTILTNKNKVRWIIPPNVKTNYVTTVIKTAWKWQRDRVIDWCNRTRNWEIHLHKRVQPIFKIVVKAIKWRNRSFQERCWCKWTSTIAKKINLGLTLYTKLTEIINHKTINLLEMYVGNSICDLSKDFLYLTHKAQSINRKMDKSDFIKILKVWPCKGTC